MFKCEEHLQRLARSMKTIRLQVPYTLDEIGRASLDLLRANEFHEDIHFIPVAYFGMGANFEAIAPAEDTGVYITGVPRPQLQGNDVRTGERILPVRPRLPGRRVGLRSVQRDPRNGCISRRNQALRVGQPGCPARVIRVRMVG